MLLISLIIFSFFDHNRLKCRFRHMFIWCNYVRLVYLIMLISCIYFVFRVPNVTVYSKKLMEALTTKKNESLTFYDLFELEAASKCINEIINAR